MKTLGIDISTHAAGYAFIKDGKLVDYGKVSFGGGSQFNRMQMAALLLNEFGRKSRYSILAIEEIPFVNNKVVFGQLSLFYGMSIAALYKPKTSLVLPKPLVWQREIGNELLTRKEKDAIIKAAPGKSRNWYSERGRERRKQRTAEWVKSQYGVTITDHDITDSIAIAYYGSKHG